MVVGRALVSRYIDHASKSLRSLHHYAQVRQVAEEAIARARRGEGPTLIEAETYRFRGHSLADPDELRTKEEKDYYLVSLILCFSALGRSGAGGASGTADCHAAVRV